jgi:hypothetical protein
MALLQKAARQGHPSARACLGLGKRVILHGLQWEGDAEYVNSTPRASSSSSSSSSSSLSAALDGSRGGAAGGVGEGAAASDKARRRRCSGGASCKELNGAVGVATAFDDATNRFVVQLESPAGQPHAHQQRHHNSSSLPVQVCVKAANLRMER